MSGCRPHHAYCADVAPRPEEYATIRRYSWRCRDERLSRRRPDPRSVPARDYQWWCFSLRGRPQIVGRVCAASAFSRAARAPGRGRTGLPHLTGLEAHLVHARRWYHPRCIRRADALTVVTWLGIFPHRVALNCGCSPAARRPALPSAHRDSHRADRPHHDLCGDARLTRLLKNWLNPAGG